MRPATSEMAPAPVFLAAAATTTTTTTTTTTKRSRPSTSSRPLSPEQPQPQQQPPVTALRRGLSLSKKTARSSLRKKSSFSRIRRGSSSVVGFASQAGTGARPDEERLPQQLHHRSKSVTTSSSSTPAGTTGDIARPPPLPATTPTAIATSAAPAALMMPGNTPVSLKMMGTSALLGPYAGASYSTAASALTTPSHNQQPPENVIVHQHIQDVANKRISTLDYLRKAQEGRVYWFNTLRYDRPDLARMPYFDARRLARRATNYLLLGLSIPAVIDLNGASATDLLRSFSALLAEFESFQQLHAETGGGSGSGGGGGGGSSSLSRAARLPHMFRRATPGSKVRRTSSSATAGEFEGGGTTSPSGGAVGLVGSSSGGSGGGLTSVDSTLAGSALTLVASESGGSLGGAGISLASTPASTPQRGGSSVLSATALTPGSTSFATYYDNNTDLLPGEEYALLLTPSLPFDPDFYETFATLCDVLIDCYARILSLLPTARECTPAVGDLFNKVDARVRKLLVQGVVKEFEEHSRAGVKTEVANIGRVVLGGLMG